MNPSFWARRVHRWIALVIGIQALLWMVSGLYMTAVSLEVIHGDHLVHADAEPLSLAPGLLTADALSDRYPGLKSVHLKRLLGREVYELHQAGSVGLIDARSGLRLSPLGESDARLLAASYYQGQAPVAQAALWTVAPQEVATRPVPMWSVSFADRGQTTLYFSAQTGELLARRHNLWRWFDFLWMFHIMDYEARTDVNNPLLRVATVIGLVFALSGAWLLFHRFRRSAAA